MGNAAEQTETQALAPVPAITPIIGKDDSRSINAFSNEANFATAQRMAKALAASTLVPAEYRNNIPNVVIAMELAARIGASPFAVMQNIDIIHGRPSWRATFLIATVNACGRFTPLRFRMQGQEGTKSWGCRAYATDTKTGEECVGALITIALAHSEGWFEKKGSKWKTMPEQMLMYRAAAFWVRIYAPELSLGMHTRDELDDMSVTALPLEPRVPVSTNKPSALAEKVAASSKVTTEAEPEDTATEPESEPDYDRETGEVYDAAPPSDDDIDALL